jgi:hypothetical protein
MRSEPLPLATEVWPLSRFVEYERNPRKNDAAVDRMCASIREFGFKIPCVVRELLPATSRFRQVHVPVSRQVLSTRRPE